MPFSRYKPDREPVNLYVRYRDNDSDMLLVLNLISRLSRKQD